MEQFDPKTQKTFNRAAKIDPFGDPQAEYEHAQRCQTSAESLRAGTRSISDLVPNET